MISVPCGTGDIADAMISAAQMIYAFAYDGNGYYIIFTEQIFKHNTAYKSH